MGANLCKPKASWNASNGSQKLTDFFSTVTGEPTLPPEMPHETFRQMEDDGMLDPVSGRLAKLFCDYQPHLELELTGLNLGNWHGHVCTLNQLLDDYKSAWRVQECPGTKRAWIIMEIKEGGSD